MPDLYVEWVTSISTTSTGDTSGTPKAFNGCDEVSYEIKWPASITGGTVVIEQSKDGDYSGTWAERASVNFSAAGKLDYDTLNGRFGFVRARAVGITGSHTDPLVVRLQGGTPGIC